MGAVHVVVLGAEHEHGAGGFLRHIGEIFCAHYRDEGLNGVFANGFAGDLSECFGNGGVVVEGGITPLDVEFIIATEGAGYLESLVELVVQGLANFFAEATYCAQHLDFVGDDVGGCATMNRANGDD